MIRTWLELAITTGLTATNHRCDRGGAAGIGDMLSELLKNCSFGFAVERAMLVATLIAYSSRARIATVRSGWDDYKIPSASGTWLSIISWRAMAWLGEKIEDAEFGAPMRCVRYPG